MDNIINQLIQLNVELEGALRVAAERTSPEALVIANNKFDEMSCLFQQLNAIGNGTNADESVDNEIADDEAVVDVTVDDVITDNATEAEADDEPADDEPAADDGRGETVAVGNAQGTVTIHVDERILKSDIRKTLTLNDKFRFRRELFSGNDAEFNDTLDLLATMQSMEEAEEYIYDDLQWNRDDETVADFMSIICNFFNLRK